MSFFNRLGNPTVTTAFDWFGDGGPLVHAAGTVALYVAFVIATVRLNDRIAKLETPGIDVANRIERAVRRSAASSPDPLNPLTWPVTWSLNRICSPGHAHDLWWAWRVTRPLPRFGCEGELANIKAGLNKSEALGSGEARTLAEAKAAIEGVLYGCNIALADDLLSPRIDVHDHGVGFSGLLSGEHVPTPGGRP